VIRFVFSKCRSLKIRDHLLTLSETLLELSVMAQAEIPATQKETGGLQFEAIQGKIY
jgi:hypothetical protein